MTLRTSTRRSRWHEPPSPRRTFAAAHTVGLHHNLGLALGLRYQQTGEVDVLQEAAHASRRAFEATPEGAYGRGSFLGSFALRLIQLHRRTRQPGVLDEAIELLERGLAGPGTSSLERVGLHHNLAAAWDSSLARRALASPDFFPAA